MLRSQSCCYSWTHDRWHLCGWQKPLVQFLYPLFLFEPDHEPWEANNVGLILSTLELFCCLAWAINFLESKLVMHVCASNQSGGKVLTHAIFFLIFWGMRAIYLPSEISIPFQGLVCLHKSSLVLSEREHEVKASRMESKEEQQYWMEQLLLVAYTEVQVNLPASAAYNLLAGCY